MDRLDFYKLSRPVQERFIGSVDGTGLPAPILEWRSTPREPFAWVGLSIVAAAALAFLFRAGFGDLESARAIQALPVAGTYVVLVFTAMYGLLHALRIWNEVGTLPFKPGIYVFPVGLIDARRRLLRMYKIEELSNVQGPDGKLAFALRFGGASFSFAARDSEHAQRAEVALGQARGLLQDAAMANDGLGPKGLAALDPLHGVANPLVSSVPISRSLPPWARFDWAVALVVGLSLGFALWAARNAKSDDRMYTAAAAADDVASYRAYLERGTRHKEEIAHVLLPRAELRDAVRIGSVDAIERYMKQHPMTAIGNEVTYALRKAMVAELEAAKQAGTLTALVDFAQKHPDHHLDADLRAARHAVYQAALESYRKSAPPKSDAAAFVERLIAYAERHGPAVQIRFRHGPSKLLDRADAAAGKNKNFRGVTSLPSRYFEAADDRPREEALGAEIAARFAQAFPPDVLAFAAGAPLDADAPLPAPTVPTLFIEHATEWTGGVMTSVTPHAVFVALSFNFNCTFQIPDDPKPRTFKAAIHKAPPVSEAKDEEKPEEKVYSSMAKAGYEQFEKKYFATFFQKDNSP